MSVIRPPSIVKRGHSARGELRCRRSEAESDVRTLLTRSEKA